MPIPRIRACAACAAAALALAACDRSAGPAPPVNGAPPSDPAAAGQAEAAKAPASTDAGTARTRMTGGTADLMAPVARPPSDAEITASAAKALSSEPALAGAQLSVTTDHGVVSLTGSVRSPEQIALAEARAQSPTGVMRVESHLTVRPG